MDAISYSYADKQAKRIKKFINDPDSTSGVLTVPKVIASGESVTIPAGRVAILPDLQVDGDLVVDGDLFIPTGSMTSQVVQKVTSTDNAIVRFNGTTGDVQNSGVIIDDSGKMDLNKNSDIIGVLGRKSDSNMHLEIGANGVIDSTSQITMGWSTNKTYAPVAIVAQNKNGTGSTYADLIFATRSTNADVAPTERMRIDSSGNVGIGVTPSAWQGSALGSAIDIGNGNGSISSKAYSNGSNVTVASNAYVASSSNTWTYKVPSYYATRYEQNNGIHTWYTAPSGTAGNVITWNNAMTLDANGNLGLGTNSPTQKISVQGNMYNAQSTSMRILDAGDFSGNKPLHHNYIETGSTHWGDDGFMAFGTQNVERMRIGMTGLLIGTSVDNGVDKLQVNGSINAIYGVNSFNGRTQFIGNMYWDTMSKDPNYYYITNANNLEKSGRYNCLDTQVSNLPSSSGEWWYIDVMVHSNNIDFSWVQQIAYPMGVTGYYAVGVYFIRQKRAGTWTAWVQK